MRDALYQIAVLLFCAFSLILTKSDINKLQ